MWHKIDRTYLKNVSNYLLERESALVLLSTKFHQQNQLHWPDNALVVAHFKDQTTLDGLAYCDLGGMFFITLAPELLSTETESLRALTKNLRNPFSLIGEPSALALFNQQFYDTRHIAMDYYIMDWHCTNVAKPTNFANIKASTERNFRQLAVLEEAYQNEEVLLPGSKHAPMTQILNSYKKKLSRENCFHLEDKGQIVAKASFTAEAAQYDLLGGVFTPPNLRGRGYAKALVTAMQYDAFKRHKNITLFVKKSNKAAQALYKGCQFNYNGDLKIIYPNL